MCRNADRVHADGWPLSGPTLRHAGVCRGDSPIFVDTQIGCVPLGRLDARRKRSAHRTVPDAFPVP